jgi:DNA-binding winged helix-turn-helix (wHTH) protein
VTTSYRFHDLELDPVRFRLRRGGTDLSLPRQVFDLILLLVRHRDRPVTKAEILRAIWPGRTVTDASLTQAIAAARRALGDTPEAQAVIKTVHGRGYWWVAETEEVGSRPATPFVGRDSEVDLLSAELARAIRGNGRFVFVVGEAGIGKSKLVDRFEVLAGQSGAAVIKACAEDLDPVPPLYLWRSIASQDMTPTARRARGGDASADQTAFVGREAQSDYRIAQLRFYESLLGSIRHLTTDGSLLIVLEDIHKADISSLHALHFISARIDRLPLMILATHRPCAPHQPEAQRRQIASLARRLTAPPIILRGLTIGQIEDFLRELSDPSIPSERAREVFEACGGNPFMLWQLVGIARARDVAGTGSGQMAMPGTVRDAIAEHAHQLPSEAFDMLQVAAVLGHTFDLRVLQAVLSESSEQAPDLVEGAVAAGLLRPRAPYAYEFSHALLREALYEQIAPTRRSHIHHSAGKAMLDAFGREDRDTLPATAFHFRRAMQLGTVAEATALLELCGDHAVRDLAFGDSVRFFSDALDLLRRTSGRDVDREIGLLLKLGSARLANGDREGARSVLFEAARLASAQHRPAALAEAALAIAPDLLSIETGVIDIELISLLEEALNLDRVEQPTRIQLAGRLALALYWTGEDRKRKRLVEQLRRAREEPLEPGIRVRALLHELASSWGPDTLAERLAGLEVISSSFPPLQSPLGAVVRVLRFASFLELGSLERMRLERVLLESEVRRVGEPYGTWYPSMFRATECLLAGKLNHAAGLAREYFEVGERLRDWNVRHSFAAQVAEAQWLRGGAEAALNEGEEFASRHPNMPEWMCTVAFLKALVGQADEASLLVESLAPSLVSKATRGMNYTIALAALAEVVTRLKMRSWASPLYRALEPYRAQNVVAGFGVISWGSVSRFLGQLAVIEGRLEEGQALLEEALRVDQIAGAATWIARSEVALAGALKSRGGELAATRSRELLSRCRRRASDLGLVQIERDALRLDS